MSRDAYEFIHLTIIYILLICLFTILISIPKQTKIYENTDVNRDGVTDIRDLTIVQKKIVEDFKKGEN